MVDKKKSSATTARIEKGEIKVAKITITKKQPLFILFAYGGGGAADFLAAARYKEARIKKKYPDAEVKPIIDDFEYVRQFTAKWTALYQELCKPESRAKYDLWEVHYFGHGGHDVLSFRKDPMENNKKFLTFDDIDKMEILPWHPNNGIFVLHSCRGAAYEDSCDADKINEQICLAKYISKKQQTRCLGQVVYANFSHQPDQTLNNSILNSLGTVPLQPIAEIPITEKEKQDAIKYRPNIAANLIRKEYKANKVLWGYALLTGETGDKIKGNRKEYENSKSVKKDSSLPQEYPIYQEVALLANKNQILPCRVFNKGKLDEHRVVAVDVFNDNDLEYI